MTSAIRKLTDVQRRQSETRTALARLDALAEDQRPADYSDQVAKLEKQATDLEPELRAALQAVDEEDAAARVAAATSNDPELRERRRLRDRFSVGRFFAAISAGHGAAGAEAEYRQALKLPELGEKGHIFPLDVLEAMRPERPKSGR